MKYVMIGYLVLVGFGIGMCIQGAYPDTPGKHDKEWYLLTAGQMVCYGCFGVVLLGIVEDRKKKKDKEVMDKALEIKSDITNLQEQAEKAKIVLQDSINKLEEALKDKKKIHAQ